MKFFKFFNMDINEARRKFEKLPSSAGQDAGIYLDIYHKQNVQIAELVIRSEKSKNALSGKMISELTERIDELEAWTSSDRSTDNNRRCLLIKGYQGTFCSGSDLKTARATLDTLGEELAQLMQHNFRRLAKLPVISIAYIEGYALGGGAELALAADLRIMSSDAKIGFVHAKNGICCGWSGGTKLVQLVGRSNALELLSSGRLVTKDEAELLGIACKWNEGSEYDFCANHATNVGWAVKSLVHSACEMSVELALENECRLFVATWGKQAHREALDRNVKHNK